MARVASEGTRRELDALFSHVLSLVLKDEAAAEAAETPESSAAGYALVAAAAGAGPLSPAAREALLASYVELNPYYAALRRDHGVDPVAARTAPDMAILAGGTLPPARAALFRDEHAACARYWAESLHTRAYSHQPLYAGFGRLVVALWACLRYAGAALGRVHDPDFADERSLRNMAAGIGLGDGSIVPARYLRRLLKNANPLLRLKGTTAAVAMAVSLFGMGSVRVRRHYLAPVFPEADDGPGDWGAARLRFFSVDHDAPDLEAAMASAPSEDFARFTGNDPYWAASEADVLAAMAPAAGWGAAGAGEPPAGSYGRLATKHVTVGAYSDLVARTVRLAYFKSLLRRADLLAPAGSELSFLDLEVSPRPVRARDALVACMVLAMRLSGLPDRAAPETAAGARVLAHSWDPAAPLPAAAAAASSVLRWRPDGTAARPRSGEVSPAAPWDPAAEPAPFPRSVLALGVGAGEAHALALRAALASPSLARAERRALEGCLRDRLTAPRDEPEYGGYGAHLDFLRDRDPALGAWLEGALSPEGGPEASRARSADALLALSTSLGNFASNGNEAIDPASALEPYLLDDLKGALRAVAEFFKSYRTELRPFFSSYAVADPYETALRLSWAAPRSCSLPRASFLRPADGAAAASGLARSSRVPARDGAGRSSLLRRADALPASDGASRSSGRAAAGFPRARDASAPSAGLARASGLPLSDGGSPSAPPGRAPLGGSPSPSDGASPSSLSPGSSALGASDGAAASSSSARSSPLGASDGAARESRPRLSSQPFLSDGAVITVL